MSETSPQPNAEPTAWERQALEKVLLASVTEQRRARRWNIFFKSLLFLYLFSLLVLYLPQRWMSETVKGGRHTALIDIEGVIAPGARASADNIVGALRAAFEDTNTAGIILRINSPGGSPVQSGYISDEIHRLRELNPDVPVFAVISDICASGGYYIAAAADEIYADKASMVGSIGVIMNGFGFVDAMDKLGVERRLLVAGDKKALLDPFSPLSEGEVRHIQGMLDQIHTQFIDSVKAGRGERLDSSAPELFSGLIWTGERGVELGLVDALGSSSFVAREVIGVEDIVDFTPRERVLERLARQFGGAAAETLLTLPGLR